MRDASDQADHPSITPERSLPWLEASLDGQTGNGVRATATRPDTNTRHFDRKVDALQWLDQVTAAVVTGTYADPKAGQITFTAFFGEWSVRQVWAPGTVLAMSLAARSVPFGDKAMRQVRRSDVEVWIKSMDAAGLAPGTIKTRYVNVRSVFRERTVGVPRRRQGPRHWDGPH